MCFLFNFQLKLKSNGKCCWKLVTINCNNNFSFFDLLCDSDIFPRYATIMYLIKFRCSNSYSANDNVGLYDLIDSTLFFSYRRTSWTNVRVPNEPSPFRVSSVYAVVISAYTVVRRIKYIVITPPSVFVVRVNNIPCVECFMTVTGHSTTRYVIRVYICI